MGPRSRSTRAPTTPGNRSTTLAGHVCGPFRSPSTTRSPPPFSTNSRMRCPARPPGSGASFSTRTDRPSKSESLNSRRGRTSTRNDGLSPISNARLRKRLWFSRASELSKIRADKELLGLSTKTTVLSCGKASVPAVTAPRETPSGNSTGENVTAVLPRGSTVTVRLCSSWPLRTSATRSPTTCRSPPFTTRVVTLTHSRPDSTSCRKETNGNEMLCVSSSDRSTAVTIVPPGSRTSDTRSQPERWKSVMSTTSRSGCSDSERMRPASCSAEPYRVPPAVGSALSMAFSPVTSAVSANSTTVARSNGPSRSSRARACSTPRCHRSPNRMLCDLSSKMTTSLPAISAAVASVAFSKNGRAKARASSMRAKQRIAKSSLWRSCCRRTSL